MKAFVVLAVVVGAAFGAPTEDIGEIQRVKKGAYGAPCGAAGPIAAPIALYLSAAPAPISAIPTIPHYREDEHAPEKDIHHEHQARSYYDGPAAASAAAASAAASAAAIAAAGAAASPAAGPAAPAIGVFPGAKIGGCAVPLLLSCAPSVHSGHLAHSAYPSAAPAFAPIPIAAPAYRAGAEHKMREMTEDEHEAKMREMAPAKAGWAEAERSSQSQMRESIPVKSFAESARGAAPVTSAHEARWATAGRITQSQMRESIPVKSFTESAHGVAPVTSAHEALHLNEAKMREMTPAKARWATAERSSQALMRESIPVKSFAESARGAAPVTSAHVTLHHHADGEHASEQPSEHRMIGDLVAEHLNLNAALNH